MIQLLFGILIIAAAIGLFRCQDESGEPPTDAPSSVQQLQQTPQRVEQEINQQVDAINRRNQENLNRY